MHHPTKVGVDVHAATNEVFALRVDTGEFARASLTSDPAELVGWLASCPLGGPYEVAYEAGPTGFGLQRALEAAGHRCIVAAAAKLAKRNDGVKNDRVDAEWLARQLAAGAVVASYVPTPELEALRSLARQRCDFADDLRRARQRATSFLLSRGVRDRPTKKNWTKAFSGWARKVALPGGDLDRKALDRLLDEVDHLEALVAEAETDLLGAVAARPALAAVAARLRCLTGVGPVTSALAVCEVGDFSRFGDARSFESWLGLTPSERSSGETRTTGRITKRGDARLRKALVECAQCYARGNVRDRLSADDGVPLAVREHALKGSRRLRRRSQALLSRGKATNKRKVAVARELAGWMFHLAVM